MSRGLEEIYAMTPEGGFGYRDGQNSAGEPAPLQLRQRSANGAARVLGYTCPSVYHALHQHADGHPDPETGEYMSISTQYRLEAIPAFVVDVDTDSVNVDRDTTVEYSNAD
jgi:hypothetical protein